MTDRPHAPGLLDEPPMLVYPSLAVALGINKAVVFQQLHFLINGQKVARNKYNFVDNRWWVYNSYPEWKRDFFPWLSVYTLKGIFSELEKQEKVILSQQGVKNKSDRRKWYTIDYPAWDNFWLVIGQKMSDQPSDKKCLIIGQKLPDDLSETPSEIPDNSTKPSFSSNAEEIDSKYAEQWAVAYSQLKIQLDFASFETFLRGIQLVGVEGNLWQFTAVNQYAADSLQHRLYREVRRVLSDVLGVKHDQIELQFQVADKDAMP